jgi:hypothetical protein
LVDPRALRAHMKQFGLQPVYFCPYLGSLIEEIERKNPLLGRLLIGVANLVHRLSLGAFDLLRGDYHLVLRKI